MQSRVAILLAGLLLCATGARGQTTDLERFQKKVRKYGVPVAEFFVKQKGLCVCISDNNASNTGAAGALDAEIIQTQDNSPGRVRVRCLVMKGDADGKITQAEECDDWVPLAR
jgi:hypothetical protein